MEKRYVMAADFAKRSMFEIRFPRSYNIYFSNNNVVTEFQCYSEMQWKTTLGMCFTAEETSLRLFVQETIYLIVLEF